MTQRLFTPYSLGTNALTNRIVEVVDATITAISKARVGIAPGAAGYTDYLRLDEAEALLAD
ncbi:MAG: hypothetical protein DCF27_06200 [Lysobacteraceae bacterium]|nr:MAG: hypothetical protein DCF27_06200 [Xanthomonadaceae bacterium]